MAIRTLPSLEVNLSYRDSVFKLHTADIPLVSAATQHVFDQLDIPLPLHGYSPFRNAIIAMDLDRAQEGLSIAENELNEPTQPEITATVIQAVLLTLLVLSILLVCSNPITAAIAGFAIGGVVVIGFAYLMLAVNIGMEFSEKRIMQQAIIDPTLKDKACDQILIGTFWVTLTILCPFFIAFYPSMNKSRWEEVIRIQLKKQAEGNNEKISQAVKFYIEDYNQLCQSLETRVPLEGESITLARQELDTIHQFFLQAVRKSIH